MAQFFYAAEVWSAGERKYKVSGLLEIGSIDWAKHLPLAKEQMAKDANCDPDDLAITALNFLPNILD